MELLVGLEIQDSDFQIHICYYSTFFGVFYFENDV